MATTPLLSIMLLLTGWLSLLAPVARSQTNPPADPTLAAMPNDTAKLSALIRLAHERTDKSPEQGLPWLQQARQLNDELQSAHHAARLDMLDGYIAVAQGDYVRALQRYLRAHDQFVALDNPERVAFALLRIGQVLERQREYVKAESYLNRGLRLAQQHGLRAVKTELYGELGNLADIQGHPDRAVQYARLSLDNLLRTGDTTGYYYGMINLGIHYKNLRQFDTAVATYEAIRAYAQRTKDDYLLVYVDLNMPYALMGLNRLDAARRVAEEGMALSRRMPESLQLRTEASKVLYEIAKRRQDFPAALTYHEEWVAGHDSLLNNERSRQLNEIETRHATRAKEAQIAELNLQNAQATRQRAMLGGGLGLTLLLLGGLSWQYVRLRQQKRIIERQSAQVTLMMKELHHRVKNNLAIVSSLLNLQSSRLSDENAQRAFQEGQQRIEAMALIHQRLYQSNQVTTVNMQQFVVDLVNGLMYAYGYTPDQLQLDLHIDQPELDVDRAIPLGLILNELLTNAFKYAFPATSRPHLTIRLTGEDGAGLTLDVHDNGPGLDLARWTCPDGSFGKRLIRSLSEQTGGKLLVHNENGMRATLQIPAIPTGRAAA